MSKEFDAQTYGGRDALYSWDEFLHQSEWWDTLKELGYCD